MDTLTAALRPCDLCVTSGIATTHQRPFGVLVLGGATAGVSVDLALFPLDTLKTRLQSQHGFLVTGGFKGIYKGVGPTALISPISAGLFIGAYETAKQVLVKRTDAKWEAFIHMFSASVGEMVACIARVPMEVVKQRRQASIKNVSSINILFLALQQEGLLGLYRGFGSTVLRDVPFSMIEFPIWEWLKKTWKSKMQRELATVEVAMCGAIAGAFAATMTTPLDVIKTQIMLADCYKDPSNLGIVSRLRVIYYQYGIKKLFAGLVPRISLISIGGAIFFGVYDKSCKLIDPNIVRS